MTNGAVDFLRWLEQLPFSIWVAEADTLLAYPGIITLHTIGLAIVFGANALLDVRLLGLARRVPLAELRGVFPAMVFGFALNGVTGVELFMPSASTLAVKSVFWIKLLLVAAAVAVAFRQRAVVFEEGAARDDEPPAAARRLAVVSLLLWIAATTAGRLVAYI